MKFPNITIKDSLNQVFALDSQSLLFVNSKNSNQSNFSNIIEGQAIYTPQNGIFSNISIFFTGEPGSTQFLNVSSNFFSNQKFSLINLLVFIRNCSTGEYFTERGK